MDQALEKIKRIGVVPVVVLNESKDAKPLAEALCRGGLPCAEVTFRTEAAEESIRIMAENCPDMLIGAGTVLTIQQVDKAVSAGAVFIVTPGFDPEIVDYCILKQILVIPGCITPSEVAQAVKRGLTTVKFFPAQAAGGLEMIKALAAPFHNISFMPTGGISMENLKNYLEYGKVLACGGSYMVQGDLIREGKFKEIERLTKETASFVREIKGAFDGGSKLE